jgi:hypothetical protein
LNPQTLGDILELLIGKTSVSWSWPVPMPAP